MIEKDAREQTYICNNCGAEHDVKLNRVDGEIITPARFQRRDPECCGGEPTERNPNVNEATWYVEGDRPPGEVDGGD